MPWERALYVAALTCAQHVQRLKVDQLKAVLAYRVIIYDKGAKKPDLLKLVSEALALPEVWPMPSMPEIPGVVDVPTAEPTPAGDAGSSVAANVEEIEESSSSSESEDWE